jgi:assimilatory nitrate reductase catalytic subunit
VLEADGPQQWPYPSGASAGKVRLYEDGQFPTADGKAKFVAIEHQATAELTTADLPISLLSGRMRDHWHGMSRTGTVPRLFNLEDEPLLAMHPCDMRHRQLDSGDLVKVSNGRGEMTVRIIERPGLKKGRAWMPMHWGNQFMNSAGANAVASDATDPYSKQPELKHAAVQIAKLDLPYPLAVVRSCGSQTEALELQQQVRRMLVIFPYATLNLYGRTRPLVVFRAAAEAAISIELIAALDAMFGMAGDEGAILYADASRNISKKAIAIDGRLLGVRLAGETLAQTWLKQAMAEDELDAGMIRFALAPSAKAPGSIVQRNIVCKCADISDVQIQQALATGADLPQLQEKLKCGTFCGSCVPDIKRMVVECSIKQAATV